MTQQPVKTNDTKQSQFEHVVMLKLSTHLNKVYEVTPAWNTRTTLIMFYFVWTKNFTLLTRAPLRFWILCA